MSHMQSVQPELTDNRETIVRRVLELPHGFSETDLFLAAKSRIQGQYTFVSTITDLEYGWQVTLIAMDYVASLSQLLSKLSRYQTTSVSEDVFVAFDITDVSAAFR
jgi:hypothetical protein